jgi:hypothetical protein
MGAISALDNENLDVATRIEYHLPLEGDMSSHDLTADMEQSQDRPESDTIPTTAVPEMRRPRSRALGVEQRALVRILSRTKQVPTWRLAAHFRVSVAVIHMARNNNLTPKDDVAQGMPYHL